VVFGTGSKAGQLNPATCNLAGLLIVSKLTRASVLGLPLVSHQSSPIPFSLKCHFFSLRNESSLWFRAGRSFARTSPESRPPLRSARPLSNLVGEATKRIRRKPAGGRKFGTAGRSAASAELIDRKTSIYAWPGKCIPQAETKEHTHGN
jgi:hypothetical protein